jgi:hypothetical protein
MKFDKIHGEFEDDFFMDTKESGSEYNLVKKFTLVMRDFAARYDSENSNTSMGGDPFLYQVLYSSQRFVSYTKNHLLQILSLLFSLALPLMALQVQPTILPENEE